MSDIFTPPPIKLTDLSVPITQQGLDSPTQNDFYSERLGYLWGIAGNTELTYDERKQEAARVIAASSKETVKASLGDAARVSLAPLQANAELELRGALAVDDYVTAQQRAQEHLSMSALSDGSLENPVDASSESVVWNLAPTASATFRDSMALHDVIAGTMSGRLEGDSIWKQGADLFTSVVVPGRMSWGMAQANSYFDTLKAWNAMDTKTRYQNWKAIEADLWEASGNNSIVYASLASPFLDASDEIWRKVDVGLDAVAVGSLLFSGVRAANVLRGLQTKLDFRALAQATGNEAVLGEAQLSKVKGGDVNAIVEGTGIEIPKGDEYFPEIIKERSVPLGDALTGEMEARGLLGPNVERSGMEAQHLSDSEKQARIDFEKSRLIKAGRITNVAQDGAGFDVTLQRPTMVKTPISNLIKSRTDATKTVKKLQEDLKAELAGGKAGDLSQTAIDLTSELRVRQLEEKELADKLKRIREVEKTSGKVTHFYSPTTKEETLRFNWNAEDTAQLKFSEAEIGYAGDKALSKESTLDVIPGAEGMTAEGTLVDMKQRKVFADYSNFYQEVRKWMKRPFYELKWGRRNPKNRVEAVLMRGDFKQAVFSDAELTRGIDTDLGKIYLTQDEIQAYRGARTVFDSLWFSLNKMRREARSFAGQAAFKVKYTDKASVTHDVDVFAYATRDEHFKHSIPTMGPEGKARHVIDAATGNVVDLKAIPTLEADLLAKRKAFVELSEAFYTADGKQYKHLLVDVDHYGQVKKARQAGEIPYHVLPYRRGYVPKLITDPIFHVVEETDSMVVNGLKMRNSRVIRGFQSAREAQIFISNADRAYYLKGGKSAAEAPSAKWKALALNGDFKKSRPKDVEFISDQLFQGSFAGHRTDGVFKVGLEGAEGTRMSVFETMQRYADYVGRHTPMHTYKQAKISQFLKSAQGMLTDPSDWTSKLLHSNTNEYRAASAMQDWMKSTFAVPTSDESIFTHFADDLAHGLDSAIFKNDLGELRRGASIAKWTQMKLLQSSWARDPFQAARSLAFDMYLGMFNPVQLLVQSAGMLTPFSLHPIEASAAMGEFMALRMLHGMRDAESAGQVAKAMGLNAPKFKQMWNAYKRAGVAESILNNADFGTYVNHIGGYYSTGMWDSIKKSGRIFYNIGELNNRTFAWVMAYKRLAKSGKLSGSGLLTAKEVNAVTTEGLRLGMNLSSANRARFQQGAMALPTQFWKVTTQFYENAFKGLMGMKKGGSWTQKESSAALFNSLLLFGAAGFSVDEIWKQYEPWLIDQFGLDPSTEKGSAAISAFRGGFVELVTHKAFNADLDISDRISVASGINMIYENAIKPLVMLLGGEEDPNLMKMVLGASYGIKTRIGDAIGDTLSIFGTAADTNTFNKESAIQVLRSWASVMSSANNVQQAWYWHQANAIIVKSTGETLGMDPNTPVVIAKALGVDPLIVEKYYMMDRESKEYAKLKIDVSKDVAKLLREVYENGTYTTEQGRDFANKRVRFALSGLNGKDREDVLSQAMSRLDGDTKTDKLILKMVEGILNSQEQEDVALRHAQQLKVLQNLDQGIH